MKTIKNLLDEVLDELGIQKEQPNEQTITDETEIAKIFLQHINKYFYQSVNPQYISPYHEYWESNHKDILNIKINKEVAKSIALTFDDIFKNPQNYKQLNLFTILPDTNTLTKQEIANIRFYTAIQDFKIDIYKKKRNPFTQYSLTPNWFNPIKILEDDTLVPQFLEYLEAYSQGDKRTTWMKDASKFLVNPENNLNGYAYNLLDVCDGNLIKVRELLSDSNSFGFSRKKADMFIRDMLDWGIWDSNIGIEELNVASDSNTIRVAIRSGLLELEYPLLTSYLDVYCHQYSYIDSITQDAWREVWLQWKTIPNNNCPKSPASMDYLIYKSIGKQFCKLNKRKCSECVLNKICPEDKRNLKPPKSISIYGQTGWENGKTDLGGGGGIMA